MAIAWGDSWASSWSDSWGSETVTVTGALAASSSQIDGSGVASVSVDGILIAANASIDGEVAPDQITEALHPNGDISDGGWSGHDGGSQLWTYINESVANDVDYVRSPVVPSGEIFRVAFTNPIASVVPAAPVVVRYRLGKTNAGAVINFTVRLFAGATEVVEWTHLDVPSAFATHTHTLSGGQIALISDFDELELEVEAA